MKLYLRISILTFWTLYHVIIYGLCSQSQVGVIVLHSQDNQGTLVSSHSLKTYTLAWWGSRSWPEVWVCEWKRPPPTTTTCIYTKTFNIKCIHPKKYTQITKNMSDFLYEVFFGFMAVTIFTMLFMFLQNNIKILVWLCYTVRKQTTLFCFFKNH